MKCPREGLGPAVALSLHPMPASCSQRPKDTVTRLLLLRPHRGRFLSSGHGGSYKGRSPRAAQVSASMALKRC